MPVALFLAHSFARKRCVGQQGRGALGPVWTHLLDPDLNPVVPPATVRVVVAGHG